ncbi:MAG: tRNA (N6-threonylcarbamoyladenosine(37)-N6)-methyltransferase TrmO [Candidatus Thorarchaeota archaeon]|jgi:tRNA-Thr(GGU) m(6)t(6)A37 methyltransferase TsaA
MDLVASIVGHVKKPEKGNPVICIRPEFWDGVLQLDKFSHIIVLWWISERDKDEDRSNLRDYPPYDGAELSGVFASRSPARPTPIGHSVVRVESVDEESNEIRIDQIDAFDGTPVIDIKPYMPTSDRVDEARVPEWFRDNVPRYTRT